MNDRQLTRYRRDHVGFVFQFYNLMPSLTALRECRAGHRDRQRPDDPRGGAGAGRATRAHRALSGAAFRRRAAAGRHRPRRRQDSPTVLFCDEPTGALDSATGRAVLKVLKDVNERLGATVLIVTHAAATAAMADRVIHFADGDVREVVVNAEQA